LNEKGEERNFKFSKFVKKYFTYLTMRPRRRARNRIGIPAIEEVEMKLLKNSTESATMITKKSNLQIVKSNNLKYLPNQLRKIK